MNTSFHGYSKLLDVLILPPSSQRLKGCCMLGPAINLYTYSLACLTSTWCLTNNKHERYTAKHCNSGCLLPLFPQPSIRTHSRIFTNTESWYWHWYHEYLVYAIHLTILLLHELGFKLSEFLVQITHYWGGGLPLLPRDPGRAKVVKKMRLVYCLVTKFYS